MEDMDPRMRVEVERVEKAIRAITDNEMINVSLCALGLVITTYIANVAMKAEANGGEAIDKYFSMLAKASTEAWGQWRGEESKLN